MISTSLSCKVASASVHGIGPRSAKSEILLYTINDFAKFKVKVTFVEYISFSL